MDDRMAQKMAEFAEHAQQAPPQTNDGGTDVQSIYAWISADRHGVDGIIMAHTDLGPLPLIGTDEKRMIQQSPHAQKAAQMRQSTAKLVRFDRAEELREVG